MINGERVIVVGGGIAGLTAAWRLQQAGIEVLVLEGEDHVGGRMSTVRRGGFVMDVAAGGLVSHYHQLLAMAEELGVSDQVVTGSDLVGIVRDGQVHRLHSHSATDALTTKVLSWRAKATIVKLVLDSRRTRDTLDWYDITKAAVHDTETADRYARRRLGDELADYFVDPTIRGTHLGSSTEHSVVDLFFGIEKIFRSTFLYGASGMDFLCRALAERVPVETGAWVREVEEQNDGVVVHWSRAGEPDHSEAASGCVVALSAKPMAATRPQLSNRQREIIDGLDYDDVISVQIGLSRPPAEQAMAIEFPTCEDRDLGVLFFEHNKVAGRAPAGKGLLGTYWTNDWTQRHWDLDDDNVVHDAVAGVARWLPGIADDIEVTNVHRVRPAMPVSKPGTLRAIAKFLAEDAPRRVKVAGDYTGGSSTNSSLCSGQRAASLMLAALGRPALELI